MTKRVLIGDFLADTLAAAGVALGFAYSDSAYCRAFAAFTAMLFLSRKFSAISHEIRMVRFGTDASADRLFTMATGRAPLPRDKDIE